MNKKTLRILNKSLNIAITIVLLLCASYSIYCLWDNFQFYQAGLDLKVQLRNIKPKGKKPSFEELRKINPDVAAWITLDGTKIDEPIVQGKNNEEYLNKDVYGKYYMGGTVFLDSRCDRKFQDVYSLIYGHHMEKHLMFGELDLYKKKEFIQKHHTGVFMIPGKNYKVRIFASLNIVASDPYIFNTDKYTEDANGFLQYVENKAIWADEKQIEKLRTDMGAYHILALTTCSSDDPEDRIAVLAMYKN